MSGVSTNETEMPAHRADLQFLFSPRFNGYLYLGIANAVAIAAIVGAGLFLHNVRPVELLAIPISFIVANLAEWAAHQGPMHRHRPFLDFVFQRHVVYHHTYFPHDNMAVASHREWGHILFPPWAIFLVIVGSIPFSIPIYNHVSHNAAILFYQTGIAYYVLYEWMHLVYHLPDAHPIGGKPIFKALRRHHLVHHHRALMDRYNFNVNFPIADFLFFTAWRKPELPPEPEYRPDDPSRPEFKIRKGGNVPFKPLV